MSNFKFSKSSERRLIGIHKDLVRVIHRALEISDIDFSVTYGMRTIEEQEEILKKGNSRTMNSRHLTGHAVDLTPWLNGSVDGDIPDNWKYFEQVSKYMKIAAKEYDTQINWGGDWRGDWGSFSDGYHFELNWGKYPIQ